MHSIKLHDNKFLYNNKFLGSDTSIDWVRSETVFRNQDFAIFFVYLFFYLLIILWLLLLLSDCSLMVTKWLQQLPTSHSFPATSKCQKQKDSSISSSLRNEENLPSSLSGRLLVGQSCVTCPIFNQSLTRCTELQLGTGTNRDLHPDTPTGPPSQNHMLLISWTESVFWGFFFSFLIWTIFNIFIEFVIMLLLFYLLVFWSRDIWDLSSPTRDQAHTSCIGRQSQNHWTTREVPIC